MHPNYYSFITLQDRGFFGKIVKIILTWILRTVNPGNQVSDLEQIIQAIVKGIRIFKPKINGIWNMHLTPLKGLLYT